jgi:hypothetical protein
MIDLPPAKYDHAYDGPLIVVSRPVEQVGLMCRTAGGVAAKDWALGSIYGCSFKIDKRCYVIVPSDVPNKLRNQLFRHEQAHCNGWVHD